MTIRLDARAAATCARAIHNQLDATIPTTEWTPPAALQLRLDAGVEFEAEVVDRLRAALPDSDVVDLRRLDVDPTRSRRHRGGAAPGAPAVVVGGRFRSTRRGGWPSRTCWSTWPPGRMADRAMCR